MARKNTPPEEEIIDLTDLIEQGGSNRAAKAYAKAAQAPVEEEDFEAILAQTGATPPGRAVDPDETLDMPGMGDIDDLMASLDMPAQPAKASAPAKDARDDDLDSVLDELLGAEPGQSEQPAKSATADAIDLENLTTETKAEAPRPAPNTALESDLDDILASFDAPSTPKADKSTEAALDADLDDILSDIKPPEPVKKPAAAKPEDDLDSLLGEPTKPAAKKPDIADDLDSLLAEPAKPAKKAPEKAEPDLADDLDSLLGEPTKPAAKKPDIADDLDSLLAEPAKPAKQAPEKAEHELADDLDSLLGEPTKSAAKKPDITDDLDSLQTEPAKPAKQAPEKAEPDLTDDLDSLLQEPDLPDTSAAPVEPEPAEPPIAEDLDELIARQDNTDKVENPEPEIPDYLDNLNADSPVQPEPQMQEEIASELDDFLLQSDSPKHVSENADAPIAESLDSFAAQNQPLLTEAPRPGKTDLPVTQESREAAQAWSPEIIAGIYRTMNMHGSQEALQKFSHELGAQSAHVEDMNVELGRIGKRLLACESILSAARARIGNLEKNLDATTSLEDLIREGTPLQAGFMALITNAVANALQGYTHKDSGTELKPLIEELDARSSNISERLTALEARIAALEDIQQLQENVVDIGQHLAALEDRIDTLAARFETGLDKTVASAVAKMLQEEISRLMQG